MTSLLCFYLFLFFTLSVLVLLGFVNSVHFCSMSVLLIMCLLFTIFPLVSKLFSAYFYNFLHPFLF